MRARGPNGRWTCVPKYPNYPAESARVCQVSELEKSADQMILLESRAELAESERDTLLEQASSAFLVPFLPIS